MYRNLPGGLMAEFGTRGPRLCPARVRNSSSDRTKPDDSRCRRKSPFAIGIFQSPCRRRTFGDEPRTVCRFRGGGVARWDAASVCTVAATCVLKDCRATGGARIYIPRALSAGMGCSLLFSFSPKTFRSDLRRRRRHTSLLGFEVV